MFDSTVLLPPSSKDDEKHPEIKNNKEDDFLSFAIILFKTSKAWDSNKTQLGHETECLTENWME